MGNCKTSDFDHGMIVADRQVALTILKLPITKGFQTVTRVYLE